jgi:hypothetical protein
MIRRHLAVVIIALMIGIVACGISDEAPGEGAKAEKGYELSATIIDALETYRAENGGYPDTLDALVPDYLAQLPADPVIDSFNYVPQDDGYKLSFHYYGPGVNTCDYSSASEAWDCSGYY